MLKDNFKSMSYAAFMRKSVGLWEKTSSHEAYLRGMVKCGAVTLKGAQNQARMWLKQGAKLDPAFLREELGISVP